jgi:phage-related protein
MDIGGFIINGVHSSDLKSFIQHRPEIPVPRRKVTLRDVPNRSGLVPFDEKAYENTTMTLTLVTYGASEEEADYNRSLVFNAFNSGGYLPFTPYFDKGKVYMVHLESMSFTGSRMYGHNQPYTLTFSVKPFKYDSQNQKMVFTTSANLINHYFFHSEPLITLYGTGDTTLVVNSESFVFKNITGSLIIDSETENCYRMNGEQIINENKKMYTIDFPQFKPGQNTVSWTGNITRIEVEPRWQSLL